MRTQQGHQSVDELLDRIERLIDIGTALSAEHDTNRLTEQILVGAKELTNADGGTLYLLNETEDALEFWTVRNDTLNIAMGGTTGETVTLGPLRLFRTDGSPNHNNVAAHVALTGTTVNISDAYAAEGFDFAGTRAFDAQTGYRSRSFLTIPLQNHENEIIGVLQLINARVEDAEIVVDFTEEDQRLAESLASQAAVALTQQQLIEAQRELFESFIRILAKAIDEKSKHTSGHCQRVPELTMLIADAASRVESGPMAAFGMAPDERYELEIAAWMHDCGKVTTPEPVMDKETKLHAMHDRIHEVDLRFELLKREAQVLALRERLDAALEGWAADPAFAEEALEEQLAVLDAERDFLRRANVGGELMSPEDQERVRAIGEGRWWRCPDGERRSLLQEDEIANLAISKGTLNEVEREVMKGHMQVTIDMLEALPYPKHLRRVPQLAGGHHERMDGKGYPKGLIGFQNPTGARMMAIADVFEALTAPDRPYREAMPLSRALATMGRMCEEGHFDPDLFDLFVRERVYLEYAERFLRPEQRDEVDESGIPGYRP